MHKPFAQFERPKDVENADKNTSQLVFVFQPKPITTQIPHPLNKLRAHRLKHHGRCNVRQIQ